MHKFNNIIINGVEVNRLMSDDDMNEYRRLVEQVPNGEFIIEIGCFDGGSLISLADIIKRKNLKVIAADLFDKAVSEDTNIKEWIPGMKERFTANITKAGIELTALCETSQDIAHWMAENSRKASFVFIDADHSYESVKKDIELLLPWTNGTMAGHDFGGFHAGVEKAVREYFPNVFIQAGTQIWSTKING